MEPKEQHHRFNLLSTRDAPPSCCFRPSWLGCRWLEPSVNESVGCTQRYRRATLRQRQWPKRLHESPRALLAILAILCAMQPPTGLFCRCWSASPGLNHPQLVARSRLVFEGGCVVAVENQQPTTPSPAYQTTNWARLWYAAVCLPWLSETALMCENTGSVDSRLPSRPPTTRLAA